MESKNFDPKDFLGAKVVSPLEQEKLVGGIATAGDVQVVTVVETIVVVVTVVEP
ncbi:hypothetical protein [Pedobacter sp. GR22-10]|uniref:hypothetical protein n=1 Tax=Pedobacter TaxID=84567 RepID=UPI0022454728|nr:hypothetical protein [Pedobacter sp. GR22-10]MCX2430490.1 hypothetical protein [Pedobacter sp. GR22-10]MDD5014899.1 hypothetical protein [Atribacterota bacterium]